MNGGAGGARLARFFFFRQFHLHDNESVVSTTTTPERQKTKNTETHRKTQRRVIHCCFSSYISLHEESGTAQTQAGALVPSAAAAAITASHHECSYLLVFHMQTYRRTHMLAVYTSWQHCGRPASRNQNYSSTGPYIAFVAYIARTMEMSHDAHRAVTSVSSWTRAI